MLLPAHWVSTSLQCIPIDIELQHTPYCNYMDSTVLLYQKHRYMRLFPMHCMSLKLKLKRCRTKPDWVRLSAAYCLAAHVWTIKFDLCQDKFTLSTTWRITLKVIIPASSINLIEFGYIVWHMCAWPAFVTEMHGVPCSLQFVHCTEIFRDTYWKWLSWNQLLTIKFTLLTRHTEHSKHSRIVCVTHVWPAFYDWDALYPVSTPMHNNLLTIHMC